MESELLQGSVSVFNCLNKFWIVKHFHKATVCHFNVYLHFSIFWLSVHAFMSLVVIFSFFLSKASSFSVCFITKQSHLMHCPALSAGSSMALLLDKIICIGQHILGSVPSSDDCACILISAGIYWPPETYWVFSSFLPLLSKLYQLLISVKFLPSFACLATEFSVANTEQQPYIFYFILK